MKDHATTTEGRCQKRLPTSRYHPAILVRGFHPKTMRSYSTSATHLIMPKRKHFDTPVPSSDPPDNEWPTPKRRDVIRLDHLGETRKGIRAQTGVPERTQTNILSGPTRRPGKKRGGRPCKLDSDTLVKMIKSLEGRYGQRIKKWCDFAEKFREVPAHPPLEFGPPLSESTVRRYMNEAGYHKCRACQKSWINHDQADRRVEFCKEHHWPEWKWRMVRVLNAIYIQITDRSPGSLVRRMSLSSEFSSYGLGDSQ